MKIEILKTLPYSRNGITTEILKKGEVHEADEKMVKILVKQLGVAQVLSDAYDPNAISVEIHESGIPGVEKESIPGESDKQNEPVKEEKKPFWKK